jgi:hypothetical protein
VRDAGGAVTQLLLAAGGMEIAAARIEAGTAQELAARLAARIESNKPLPGSETALRQLIEGLRAGQPDYTAMSPGFAQLVQRRLAQLHALASYLGEIRSVEFQGVGSRGFDVYDVHRERGSGRWRIALGSDGRILNAMGVLTAPLSLGP